MSRKSCKRKHWHTGAAGFHVINTAIETCCQADVKEEHQRDILLPAYLELESLRTGQMNSDGFFTLNEFNCMTWEMGRQVAKYRANEETGGVALLAKQRTEAAAEKLQALGDRYNWSGKFVAKADELEAIRESFDLCKELIAVLPSGMVLTAMKDAEKLLVDTVLAAKRARAA